MPYSSHAWSNGEVITAPLLNKIEQAVANAAVTADITTPGTPTGDALGAAFGPRTIAVPAEIYDDFSRKSGALAGTTALTGQAWQVTGAIPLQIANGTLTDTATAGSAGYGLIQAPKSLTYMAAEFSFAAGTTDGGLGLLAFSTGTLVAGTVSPAHVVFTPAGWLYFVVESNGAITQIAQGNFSSRLVTDGATLYTAEVVISAAEQTAYLRLPDGSTAVVTDSRINQAATWLCIEDFYQAPTTDTKPRTRRVAAHSYPIGRDQRASAVRTLAQLTAPPVWTTVTPTAPFTAASGRTVQVSKDAKGIVRARGVIQTNGGLNGTMFTLPAGFRPPAATAVPVCVSGTWATVNVNIATTGVTSSASVTDLGFYYFDNVSWSTV